MSVETTPNIPDTTDGAETQKPVSPVKKAINIIFNVLVYAFFIVCAVSLILSLTSKRNDGRSPVILGRQVLTVLTNSMEKSEFSTDVSMYEIKDIPVDSVVFVQPVPEDPAEAEAWYAALKVGDVLTFRYYYVQQVTITHRITEIYPNEDGEGYTIHLEGDNKSSDADTLTQVIDTSKLDSPNYVIGRVTSVHIILGWLINLIRSKVGIVCFIIIPSAVIAIFEIIRIVSVVLEKKRKAVEEQQKQALDAQQEAIDKQQSEMDLLRQELEALRRQTVAASAAIPDAPATPAAPTPPAEAEDAPAGDDTDAK